MIKKFLICMSIFSMFSYLLASTKYTISVCVTSNLQNAISCKKRVLSEMQGDVFIIKNEKRYHTYLNIYENRQKAKYGIKQSSNFVRKQKPFIKEIDEKVILLKNRNNLFIDMQELTKSIEVETIEVKKENIIDVKPKIEEKKVEVEKIPLVSLVPNMEELHFVSSYYFVKENDSKKEEKKEINFSKKREKILKKEGNKEDIFFKYEEELKNISMKEFDEAMKKEEENKKILQSLNMKEEKEIKSNSNIYNYDRLIIEVDSKMNIMEVYAKRKNHKEKIKTYLVSTGKSSVKKPLGKGKISQISLNPVWYPTADTKRSFKKRGIILPSVVPPGNRYNYMGAAKINLTHIVDGKNTFRIHGTLNEKTIGRNETAGCIRMKNNEVVQLANLINDFANIKSLEKVDVILK